MAHQVTAHAARPGYLSLIPEGHMMGREDSPKGCSGFHMYTVMLEHAHTEINKCNKILNYYTRNRINIVICISQYCAPYRLIRQTRLACTLGWPKSITWINEDFH